MTKESIERAKEFSGHQAQKYFPMSFQESERKTAAFIGRIAYLQGMQDPDANVDRITHLEEQCNRWGRDAKQSHEMSKKLEAANKKLREALTKENILEVITQWKIFWMNQTQNSEADRKNYLNRAMGVDANMKHNLAERLVKAFTSGGE